MKEGLYSFKQHLDQTKNLRAPTDKRMIQKDLINLQKNGFVYLDRIQEKKIDLLDLDKCLQKLNPHEHKQSESLNKHILYVQILGGLKQQEDLEKLDEFIQQKQNKQYEEQLNQLTNANQFQQKHHLFLDGKRRVEDINIVEEKKAYVRTHRLGALLSCLKSNPKYLPEDQQQQQQVDEQSEVNQQEDLSISQQKTKKSSKLDEKTIPQLIAERQEQEPELSKEFLTVFKNDTTLDKQKLQAAFPKIDFDNVQLDKKLDLSTIQTIEKLKDSTLAPLKINKVQFNPVAKHITYDVDTYEENGESVFKKMEDFHESLRKGQSQDTIMDKKIEIVTEAEKQEYKWSQNQYDLYDKVKKLYIDKSTPQYYQQQVDEDQHYHQLNKNPKFNNIYLNTTVKRDNNYQKAGNQGQSIVDSISKLQNLKFHQYETAKDLQLEDRPTKDQSQIEILQQQLQKVQESYFDKDLDDQEVFNSYNADINRLNQVIDNRGNEIFAGVEKLYRQYNSNQFDKSLQQIPPNFNGVVKLDFEKVKEQFKVIPTKQKQYNDQQKGQFSQFYQNIQNPLDQLHQVTNTQQQAKEIEQDLIHNELHQKSLYLIGQLPQPQFFANKYTTLKNGNEKSVFNLIGNQHQIIKTPDKDLQKRYRYQNILSNVDDARDRFKYNLTCQ
ncbi:unnamed protein product (macronuclear) [Paramecium tetraurelia]|uniref:Uncharacterized protein n=1 Tax=Paramecium tetraurelia TaxID=5888 RepID=A0BB33_PARTE|nr:uncharacterized protein GSPATT00000185001 [Paramecium tetraurelia]CAK55750.1 unnamed protein product [Paramecium tetraurelia]|eukprot:XP_001423148.1 hypothetical protein (macronuclear) [Paramecium tetraurelia strain d4-2]